MPGLLWFRARNLLYVTAATTTTLAIVQLSTPWFIRSSYSDCSVKLRYFWDHVETSMGGSFSYEDDCDGDATHDAECEALRAAGYTVGVFAIAQLVAAVGIFLAAWRERWMLPAWYAVIAVAVVTLLGIFVFLGQFPFRSGYCFYCLNSKSKINEAPCEYGVAYTLAWFQLIWLCIVIGNQHFRGLAAASSSEIVQPLVFAQPAVDSYAHFDSSDLKPSAPPALSTPPATSAQQRPRSNCCAQCLRHLVLAVGMTVLVLVAIIRFPSSPSTAYCTNDFNRDTVCPAAAGYAPEAHSDTLTCDMLCGYSCCDADGYAGLPTDHYLSLFTGNISSGCRAVVKQMGCASCNPYISYYQTRTYGAADALSLVEQGNLPISVCDTWCHTLYHKCRNAVLVASGTSVKKAYSNPHRFCEEVFAVDEVANFAFNKHCFNTAAHLNPGFGHAFAVLLVAGVVWWQSKESA